MICLTDQLSPSRCFLYANVAIFCLIDKFDANWVVSLLSGFAAARKFAPLSERVARAAAEDDFQKAQQECRYKKVKRFVEADFMPQARAFVEREWLPIVALAEEALTYKTLDDVELFYFIESTHSTDPVRAAAYRQSLKHYRRSKACRQTLKDALAFCICR